VCAEPTIALDPVWCRTHVGVGVGVRVGVGVGYNLVALLRF